tara:strand:+ start:3443 stop:4015 length:573 start_codon:yes stop_codon:yes gene_type:complete
LVKAGEMVNGNAEDAHCGCVMGHLINNPYRIGEHVPFYRKAARFGDNMDAYEHFDRLHDIMHDGVGVPQDGANYTVGSWLTFSLTKEKYTGDHTRLRTGFSKKNTEKVLRCLQQSRYTVILVGILPDSCRFSAMFQSACRLLLGLFLTTTSLQTDLKRDVERAIERIRRVSNCPSETACSRSKIHSLQTG